MHPAASPTDQLQQDVVDVAGIKAVPTIPDIVCRTTGMRFAAVARVTEDRWIACGVRDEIAFGLEPGGELDVGTTLCHEIRQSGEAVVIDDVAADATYCGHHTPAYYGLKSYISVPIRLPDHLVAVEEQAVARAVDTTQAVGSEPASRRASASPWSQRGAPGELRRVRGHHRVNSALPLAVFHSRALTGLPL